MSTNTDHLFAKDSISVRAGLTAFPSFVFPIGGVGNSLLDSLVPGWSKKAEIITVDFKNKNLARLGNSSQKSLLCILGSVSSPIAFGHAVSIAIDTNARTIAYHDPYGNQPPQHVSQWLQQEFSGFRLNTSTVRQQYDNISCTWISMANILAEIEGKPIDLHIQKKLDSFKRHVLLAARAVWEGVPSDVKGTLDDPVGLSCFQHLEPETAQLAQQRSKAAAETVHFDFTKPIERHKPPRPLTRWISKTHRLVT